MTTWKGRAGDIRTILEQLALPDGKNTLYNPLPLQLSAGRLQVSTQSAGKTSFVMADIPVEGITCDEPQTIVLEALELLKYVSSYSGGEEVTITFSDPITIVGATRSCKIHPNAVQPVPLGDRVPVFKDGKVLFKGGTPASTYCSVDASLLQGLVSDAKLVEAPAFPISLTKDGVHVSLGKKEAKRNSVTHHIPVPVEGPDASCTIGEDFAFVVSHASGVLHLQTTDKFPLVVTNQHINYVLLPRSS